MNKMNRKSLQTTFKTISLFFILFIISFSGLALAAGSDGSADETWYQYHGNASHIGFVSGEAPDAGNLLWESGLIGVLPASSPVVADGKVFVNCYGLFENELGEFVTREPLLIALDENTGEQLWNASIPTQKESSWASPVYAEGLVFSSMNNETRCFNASNGDLLWTFSNPEGRVSVNTAPLIVQDKVFCSDWAGHHYYCLNKSNGQLQWTFEVIGSAQSTPGYGAGKLYFASGEGTGNNGHIYCADFETGKEIWNRTFPVDCYSAPVISGNIVYATTYNWGGKGSIHALNAEDGSVLWRQAIHRTDSSPAVAYGNVYVCGGCEGYSPLQTYCFNATTGAPVWVTPELDAEEGGIGYWTCSPAVADGKVFVGRGKGAGMDFTCGGTVALDAFSGEVIWDSPRGGSSPAISDGLVFTANKGRVYAFGENPDWNPWNDEGSVGGKTITTREVQEAVYYKVNNIPASSGEKVDSSRLWEVINNWIYG